MSHVLNSCKQFRNNYSKRHDKLVDKIAQELKSYWAESYNNKPVHSSFSQLDCHLTLRRLKPDIVLKSNKRVIIIEVACPYDLNMEESFVAKFQSTKLSEMQKFSITRRLVYIPSLLVLQDSYTGEYCSV